MFSRFVMEILDYLTQPVHCSFCPVLLIVQAFANQLLSELPNPVICAGHSEVDFLAFHCTFGEEISMYYYHYMVTIETNLAPRFPLLSFFCWLQFWGTIESSQYNSPVVQWGTWIWFHYWMIWSDLNIWTILVIQYRLSCLCLKSAKSVFKNLPSSLKELLNRRKDCA